MPNAEEILIIKGIRAGGIERRRFENMLWTRFSGFINWGIAKYKLSRDEIRHAYDDAICGVIINIATGKYIEETGTLLKTYAETVFNYKCINRIHKQALAADTKNVEKKSLNNPQYINESFSDMLPADVKNAIDSIIEREEQSKLQKCLEKAGEACKEILTLYASGYKDKEICDMMKYKSPDVVKQSRYRCIEKVREYHLNIFRYG